jgi:O-antigen/teichoic acid export membrane protein
VGVLAEEKDNPHVEKRMKGKYKGLLKDTMLFAVANLGSKLILFFMVPLYTNFLSTEEYGIADLVFTIAQLISPIFSLTIWDAVTRYGLKKDENPAEVLSVSAIVFLIGSAVIALITPLWGLYGSVSEWKVYLSAYAILFIANSIGYNYLRVTNKIKLFVIVSLLQTVSLAGLNILLLVVFKIGISGYLLSNVLALLISDLVIFFAGGLFKNLRFKNINKPLFKSMVLFSSPLIINNISWWIIHSSDKLMIEMFLSASDLGLYTVATKIPTLINVFITIFSQAWGISSIKEVEGDKDPKYFSTIFKVYSFLAFAAAIFLMLVIKPFMSIYVGSDFISAWQYVPLLLVAAVFSALSTYFGSLLSALHMSISTMTSTLAGGILNVVLNFIFIRIYGVWGALIGTVAAYFIIATLRMVFVLRKFKFRVNYIKISINTIIVLIQAILVSFEWHIYIVSAIAIGCFILNNLDVIKQILEKFFKKDKKIKQ